MSYGTFATSGGRAEESKVKPKTRSPPSLTLKKRGATRVIRFGYSFFREHAPPQSGEGSLLRWFWSSAGASGTVAAQSMLPLCWGCFPSRVRPAPSPPLHRDKSKVHRALACLSRALRKSGVRCCPVPASPPLPISPPPSRARSASPGVAFAVSATPAPSAHSSNPMRSAPRWSLPPD